LPASHQHEKITSPIFLGALILFTVCLQPVFALQVSPELPVIYEGWNNGQVEVVVDLTAAEKAQLTGSGVISVAVTSISLEVVRGALISIPYNGQETFPQSTAVLRKKAKFPKRDEEYNWGGYGFSATPVTAPEYVEATSSTVSVVGSHYERVKQYLTRAQIEFKSAAAAAETLESQASIAAIALKGCFTNELSNPESRRYSIFANLVNNLVPEQHFRKWLPYISVNSGLAWSSIGASYALSVEPGYLMPAIPGADPAGLGSGDFMLTFDFLERGIDRSGRSDALRDEYLSNNGRDFNWSVENRVPWSFFNQELSKLNANLETADLDAAKKDYIIAGLYNKEVRVRERLAQIGMDADSLYQGLLTDYGLDDYTMIPPELAEVIARTYTDPQYRISMPLALVVSDKDVSEGTFSEQRILSHLAKTHRVVYGQALDAAQFKAIAAKGYEQHGAFDLVVSAGHGNSAGSGAIRIGNDDLFEQLALQLKPQATVLLASCSSGDRRGGVDDTLADKMRRFLPGRRVIAAEFLTSGIFLLYNAAASVENRYHVYNLGAATVGAFDLKIAPLPDIVAAASDLSGTVVHYPAASVAALNGESLSVDYSKVSGSLFPLGDTVVVVTATDGLGHTATASFKVTVQAGLPKSQNCNLFDIILSYGALHDGFFDRDKTGFRVTVPYAVKNLRLTPLADDPTANVQVNSVTLTPGEGRLLPLNEGDNTIDVRVTAQSGTNKTYTLTVKRGAPPIGSEANADLAWLGVSSSQLPKEKKSALGYDALVPAFSASKLNYTFSVPPLATAVDVTPLLVNSSAGVTVNGSPLSAGSATVQLVPGQNFVTVAVTSANGQNTKTYNLTVNRTTWNTNANLMSLQFMGVYDIFEGASLSPSFSKDQTHYNVSVLDGFPGTRISALAPEDSNARVTINRTSVEPGSTLGYGFSDLVVTAQDGVTVKTYSLFVLPPAENVDLSFLSVSGGTLSPWFASDVMSYTVSVPNAVSTFSVTPTVAKAGMSVKVNGQTVVSGSASAPVALAVGLNKVAVEVTAPSGVKKTYTVSVTRGAASTNANLADLVVSGGTLSPRFASGVTGYTVSVPNATRALIVTPTVADTSASVRVNVSAVSGSGLSAVAVSGSGLSVPLAVGLNTVAVEVTAPSGVKKVYTVSVTRAASTNAEDLAGLDVSAGSLSPYFESDVTSYTVSVPNAARTFSVTPTVADTGASVKVNGGTAVSGTGSVPVALAVGENTVSVEVTAQSGLKKIYTVSVTRAASTNAEDLAGLYVNGGTLSPDFDSDVTSYTVNVPYLMDFLQLNTVSVDVSAAVIVRVRVNGEMTDFGSDLPPLEVGLNTVAVEVTAPSGVKKTYTLEVIRGGPEELANLFVSAGSLSPNFASHVTSYTVSVPSAVAFLNVMPLTSSPMAVVKVNGQVVEYFSLSVALAVGENTVSVEVTVPSGATKTYTVSVTREATPTIAAGQTATGTSGVAFSYQIVAGNSPTSYALSGGALPTGVTLNTSTGLLSGTPSVSGTFTPSFTATNADGTSEAQPITLFIMPPFEAWLASNGLGSATSPNSDPDADGLTLLEEYVLGGNTAASDTELISPVMSGNTLQIQFWLNVAATDVVVEVQSSSALASWTTILTKTNGGSWTGPAAYTQGAPLEGLTLVTVTDTLSTPSRFMRLRITKP
jgi:hypothetical protein